MCSESIVKAFLVIALLLVADAKKFIKQLSVYGSVECATDNETMVIPLSELQLGIPPNTPDVVRCALGCNIYKGYVAYNHRQ
jgi:hypothetical protein